ncbi:MAG TPA: LysE family transporter [Ktedonobacterales bacterium]|nr:LysE family transporter [Ktedonobacterales bacterium]
MPHALAILLPAVGLGIAYAAAPGAVNTEAIRRGLAHGARSTLLVEAGSLIGDSLWAALALTGVALFAQYRVLQVALGVAGGCFLLRLAWSALHDAWVGTRPQASAQARGDFATGTFFGLANPVALAFWSGLGSSVIALGASGIAFVLFVAAFFAGAALWCAGITALIWRGRRFVRPTLFRAVSGLCGIVLGYFGLRVLWSATEELFGRHLERGLAALSAPARSQP